MAALPQISAHADLVGSPGNVDGGPTQAGRTSSRGKVTPFPEPPLSGGFAGEAGVVHGG